MAKKEKNPKIPLIDITQLENTLSVLQKERADWESDEEVLKTYDDKIKIIEDKISKEKQRLEAERNKKLESIKSVESKKLTKDEIEADMNERMKYI